MTLMQRAKKLACFGYFEEAEIDASKAISMHSKNATWFITRAKIRMILNRKEEAVEDLIRARDHKGIVLVPIELVRELINIGDSETSIELLQRPLKAFEKSHLTYYVPLYKYFLSVSLEHSKRTKEAIDTYLETAKLFMFLGDSEGALSCIERRNNLCPVNDTLTISDLTPPRNNIETVKGLFRELVTSPNCFKYDLIQSVTGLPLPNQSENGATNKDKTHEIHQGISGITSNTGDVMKIYFDVYECCLLKDDVEELLVGLEELHKLEIRDYNHYEYKAFKVPSGTLELRWFSDGFPLLLEARLFSTEYHYPKEPYSQPYHPVDDWARIDHISFLTNEGNFEEAHEFLDWWHEISSKDALQHSERAYVYSTGKDYSAAVEEVSKAIKLHYELRKEKNSKYHLQRASYYIELGQFENALKDIDKGFPEEPKGEQFLLRARAYIGLGKIENAKNDLKTASIKFFDESDIEKRFLVDNLIKNIQ